MSLDAILIIASWYAIGVAVFLRICWEIDSEITAKDLLVSLMSGMFGPFMLVIYVFSSPSEWLTRSIWRRK